MGMPWRAMPLVAAEAEEREEAVGGGRGPHTHCTREVKGWLSWFIQIERRGKVYREERVRVDTVLEREGLWVEREAGCWSACGLCGAGA